MTVRRLPLPLPVEPDPSPDPAIAARLGIPPDAKLAATSPAPLTVWGGKYRGLTVSDYGVEVPAPPTVADPWPAAVIAYNGELYQVIQTWQRTVSDIETGDYAVMLWRPGTEPVVELHARSIKTAQRLAGVHNLLQTIDLGRRTQRATEVRSDRRRWREDRALELDGKLTHQAIADLIYTEEVELGLKIPDNVSVDASTVGRWLKAARQRRIS